MTHYLVSKRSYIGDQLIEPGTIVDLTAAQAADGKGTQLAYMTTTASALTPWLPATVYGAVHHPSQGG